MGDIERDAADGVRYDRDPSPYEFTCRVRYSEVGHRGLLTLPALVNLFQDCSTFQSEALGVGAAWLRAAGRAWVLTHWQIVIDRYPSLCESIAVGTFASSFKGIVAKRNFYLRDGSGTMIARAASTWALIDLETGRPLHPEPAFTIPYGTLPALEMPPEPRRVKVPEDAAPCAPVTVTRGLIDTNEHVNNCQYIQMALDLLPRETEPARLAVDYRRAAVLGDVIYPRLSVTDQGAMVSLDDRDGRPFAAIAIA